MNTQEYLLIFLAFISIFIILLRNNNKTKNKSKNSKIIYKNNLEKEEDFVKDHKRIISTDENKLGINKYSKNSKHNLQIGHGGIGIKAGSGIGFKDNEHDILKTNYNGDIEIRNSENKKVIHFDKNDIHVNGKLILGRLNTSLWNEDDNHVCFGNEQQAMCVDLKNNDLCYKKENFENYSKILNINDISRKQLYYKLKSHRNSYKIISDENVSIKEFIDNQLVEIINDKIIIKNDSNTFINDNPLYKLLLNGQSITTSIYNNSGNDITMKNILIPNKVTMMIKIIFKNKNIIFSPISS
jgi:hypothetical protein